MGMPDKLFYALRQWSLIVVLLPVATLSKADKPQPNPYADKLKTYNLLLQKEQLNGASLDDPQIAQRIVANLADQPEAGHPPKDLADELKTLKPTIEEPKKGRKNLGPKGFADPHFPTYLTTDPLLVTIPDSFRPAFQAHLIDNQIKFTLLSPRYLAQLSRDQLKILLDHLNKVPMKIKWKDKEGQVRTGKNQLKLFRTKRWQQTTASGALALTVGMKHQSELLTTMIALSPDTIVKTLQGEATAVMDAKVAAKALIAILSQISPDNTRDITTSAELVAQVYIGYWAECLPDQLILSLTKLIIETAKLMKELPQPFTHKQKGVLLGALLAGSMAHAAHIKSHDDKRLWVINSISNLVWAATTLLGALPVAASITASIAGVISVGVVAWAVVYNKQGSRDYMPKIREIEGHIEYSALELAQGQKDRSYMVDILETLSWMRAAIHVVGYVD